MMSCCGHDCEYPANGYNVRGIQEILEQTGSVRIQSYPSKVWQGINRKKKEDERLIYTFPMINSRLKFFHMVFHYRTEGAVFKYGDVQPRVFLELLRCHQETDPSTTTTDRTILSLDLQPLKNTYQIFQLSMLTESVFFHLVQPGDLLQLRVLLPKSRKPFIVSSFSAVLGSEGKNIPVVRLPFEEIALNRQGLQTYEMRSYRTWYLEETKGLIGWIKTLPFPPASSPHTIEVKMTVDVIEHPTMKNASSKSENLRFSFELQLINQSNIAARLSILSDKPGSVHLILDTDAADPKARSFLREIKPGSTLQIARQVSSRGWRKKTHLVRVTGFSLKLLSSSSRPVFDYLFHSVKVDALQVLPRKDSESDQKGDPFAYDPYDLDHHGVRGDDWDLYGANRGGFIDVMRGGYEDTGGGGGGGKEIQTSFQTILLIDFVLDREGYGGGDG